MLIRIQDLARGEYGGNILLVLLFLSLLEGDKLFSSSSFGLNSLSLDWDCDKLDDVKALLQPPLPPRILLAADNAVVDVDLVVHVVAIVEKANVNKDPFGIAASKFVVLDNIGD